MAELQSLLSRRRSLDEEKTQVFDSAAFRSEGALDDGSVKLGKPDTQQVNAFRSGWTSTPQFGDKEKVRCSTGAAQDSSFAEREAQSVESRRKLFDAQNRNSAIGNAKWRPQAVVATVETTESSLPATPPQNEQRQRLDRLIEFATGEASKLEKLIKEAEVNGDTKAVEIGQLLQAKSRAEFILNESRKQREQLEQALTLVEGERDEVRADNAKLEVEREKVKHLVEASQEEQNNLQQVIANFEREKTRLNSLVTRKEALEEELAQANAAATELAEKAKQSERLEKILLMGHAEQDRLDKLLSQKTSEHTAVLQQKQVLDVKLEEVVKQNEQLHIQLKNQGDIEQTKCALEEENTRLKVLTAASLAEKQNLERVLEETCQQNAQLRSELNGFVAKESQLGEQVSTLQHECDDLQDQVQVVLSVRRQAMADAVKAREETQKLETSRKEHELAERTWLEQAQKFGQQLQSLESEKDLLVQELERTKSQICNAEHRASMAIEQKKTRLISKLPVHLRAQVGANSMPEIWSMKRIGLQWNWSRLDAKMSSEKTIFFKPPKKKTICRNTFTAADVISLGNQLSIPHWKINSAMPTFRTRLHKDPRTVLFHEQLIWKARAP